MTLANIATIKAVWIAIFQLFHYCHYCIRRKHC